MLFIRNAYATSGECGGGGRSGKTNPTTGKKSIGGSMAGGKLKKKATPPQSTKTQKKPIGGSMA